MFLTVNSFLILPVFATIKLLVSSIDVIHSRGPYSLACKVDVIPGRINLAASLRSSLKGELRGFRFEPCGFGHSLMLIVCLTLSLSSIDR